VRGGHRNYSQGKYASQELADFHDCSFTEICNKTQLVTDEGKRARMEARVFQDESAFTMLG
jgi:hypothetical protein